MDIEGIRFFSVHDKDGSRMYLALAFTATNGTHTAIYGFHRARRKVDQEKAIKEFEKATRGQGNVKIVGTDAYPPLIIKQTVSAYVNGLVPDRPDDDAKRDEIAIGKLQKTGGKNHFTVTVKIDQGKDRKNKPLGKLVVEVPFQGDPGTLAGTVFHGSVGLMAEGRREVAEVKLRLYDI
jgi:hypothetical protein